MASLLLGNLGSSLLGPLGGWIGSAIGSYIDNLLFAPKPEDQKGPRIEDINVTRADPGVPIPFVFGADRINGIIIASTRLIETVNKEKVGGKGGPTQTVITYTYHVDIDYLLCEGPVLGIARIWAEGNLIRGTRYELDVSTSEYPENIGGIPYPDYYKMHLYNPDLIPWTLDRAETPTDDGLFYKMAPNRLTMTQISQSEAEGYIANNSIIVPYWKDTATGYYIPIREDHAYSEEKEGKRERDEGAAVAIPFEGASGLGNSNGGDRFYTLVSLSDFLDEKSLEKVVESGGSISIEFTSEVLVQFVRGLDVSLRTVNVYIDFYSSEPTEGVDGIAVGGDLGGDVVGSVYENSKIAFGRFYGIDVPVGTRFIVIKSQYALALPLFSDGHAMYDCQVVLSYGKAFGDDENIRDWPDYWNIYDAINDFSSRAVLSYKGVDNITVYHGTMDQKPNSTMLAALAEELEDEEDPGSFAIPAYIGRAHVVFDRLELADFGNRVPNFSFEVVQYDDVRIAAVLENLMQRAYVEEKYYDLTELPSVGQSSHVMGYTIGTKTSFRAVMETIMECFRIDCAEIGNQLVFRPRDREIQWQIDYRELSAMEPGKRINEVIEFTFRDKVEMPRSLTVRFKDVERQYQVNTAHYYRQQGPSVQESVVELSAVIVPSIAKAHARDKMRDVWLERVSVKFKLPHKYVYIYPTDIVQILGQQYGEKNVTLKVTTVTRGANGVLEVEGVLREQTLYVPEAGEVTNTNMDNTTWNLRPRPPVVRPAYSEAYLMDLPPLREADTMNGFYAAMTGDAGYRGTGLYRSIDGGESYVLQLKSSERAVTGRAVLPLLYAMHEYIDFTNTVDVDLFNPTDELESITAAQLFNGYNAALLGNEVIQFLNAEKLVGFTNRWRLSTLLRGRRGTYTDDVLNGHTYAERFVILQDGITLDLAQELDQLNVAIDYKAVPYGGTIATTEQFSFTNTGKRLRTFAPVMIGGTRDGGNNLTIQWVRSDRAYTSIVDGVDIGFADTDILFEVDIRNAADTATLRTISVPITTPLALLGTITTEYSAADQTTDGLTPGDLVNVRIYQVNFIGRGNAGIARV